MISLKNLSIQKKLPLLISLLMLLIIAIFAAITYFGIQRSAMKQGVERLDNLTFRLASMLDQSAANTIKNNSLAVQTRLAEYFQNPIPEEKLKTAALLEKIAADSAVYLAEVRAPNGSRILSAGDLKIADSIPLDSVLAAADRSAAGGLIGKIYPYRDSMFYPVIIPIKADRVLAGFYIRWQQLYASERSISQFSELVGTEARMLVGNKDESLWTDLMKPIAAPGFPEDRSGGMHESYLNAQGVDVMTTTLPMKNAEWLILVEFDVKTIMRPARSFVIWILVSGAILTLLGAILSSMLSRNITGPLQSLTRAASAIAEGNYETQVDLSRKDELGKLARTFNSMALQIQTAREDLESKVSDRTARLEAVNKELEAFSYSVSHDLRAPLRAVNGYSVMLKEDYSESLDAEGKRILEAIINNAKQMGALIDDLIAFSGMSRREGEHRVINMQALMKDSLAQIEEQEKPPSLQISIQDLPEAFGDMSMIKQVCVNILNNAVKYSSKKPVQKIEIGASENGDKNIYYVRDNGVGFDMKYSEKLFGVFQRLHSPSEFQGTGIGLALAQRIINKHQGKIWAEAVPGQGATFYFSLPKPNNNDSKSSGNFTS